MDRRARGQGAGRDMGVGMRGPWLITRPLEEASRDVAALSGLGVGAEAWPVLERVALGWTAARPDLVLLSSGSVVGAVAVAWGGWAPAPRVAAMLPETAAKARGAGLPVDLGAAGGAVALAEAVLAGWEGLGRPQTALWPTSRAGLDAPEQRRALALLEARMRVERVAVLDLARPAELDRRLAAAPAGARWVLASPTAARSLLQTHELPVPSMILCHGASTLEAARALLPPGWPAPRAATGANVVEAVLAAEKNPEETP